MIYSFFSPLAGIMDHIFYPLLSLPPVATVAILSLLSTLLIVGLSRLFTRSEEYKKIKEKSKELREKLIKVQKIGNKEEVEKVLNEMMKLNKLMMKNTFKTLILSFVIAVLILPWLSSHYSNQAMFTLPVNVPFIGNKISWLVWYVIVGFIFSLVLNKLIGVNI